MLRKFIVIFFVLSMNTAVLAISDQVSEKNLSSIVDQYV
ncbi:hypothetical protein HE1_00543 [Holospora elegans E1]|uniref:Uncharacterized protein n=1 Tax=Holospora elegans E1 TaxID=1427503 RepID=A0A023DZB6_9PROT|nr:hypothetical protein HE1_00543 [Holospora elegans E1]